MHAPALSLVVCLSALLACDPDPGDGGTGDGGAVDGGTGDGGPTDGGTTDGGTGDGGDGGTTDGGTTDGGTTDGGTGDGGDDTGVEPVVITGEASVADNDENPFSAIVTVTVDQDAEVVVHYGEGALDHQAPAVAATAGEPVEVLVLGLRADRDYTLRATATAGKASWESDSLAWSSAPLPVGWPVCTPIFTAEETTFDPDEVICTQGVTTTGRFMYFCTDHWGEPVFSLQSDSNDDMMSARPLMDGGWAATSYTNSKVLFFDAVGRQTASYTPSYFEGKTRYSHEFIDSHELYQLSTGAWAGAVAFLTNSFEYFDGGSYKLGNGLIVFDPGSREVLYDYSFHGDLGDQVAMDEKMPYSRPGNGDFAQDWTHANTILHGADTDGREYLLLSIKSQDWIFKLYPDEDELAWALGFEGDFTLVDDVEAAAPRELSPLQWAYHQHGAVFVDEGDDRMHLLMFDNGQPRHDGTSYRWDLAYSRVVQLDIDQENMLADIDFEYGSTRSTDPSYIFSSTCGNTVLLEDEARVMTLDGEGAVAIELSYPEGEERWRMQCETTEWCEYRVAWYPNMYDTSWIYR